MTARSHGGRSRDATNLVADLIRREYYYDESAGIPIVLQKSIRSASRRLRHSREGSGLPPGGLGLAVAVVRGSELYVATAGDAEAYLVRAARLLMPEREPGPGLPADDTARIDVWRGDFSVGDSLLLCSKNLVDVVGTEELKNAVVTLHPQSAVEHLHHSVRGGRRRRALTPCWRSRRPRLPCRRWNTSSCRSVRPSHWPAHRNARPSRWPTSSPAPPPPCRIGQWRPAA